LYGRFWSLIPHFQRDAPTVEVSQRYLLTLRWETYGGGCKYLAGNEEDELELHDFGLGKMGCGSRVYGVYNVRAVPKKVMKSFL